MSNLSIVIMIFLIWVTIYFIKQYGFKGGLVYSIAVMSVGASVELVSIYGSTTVKAVFLICLFILVIILNYPPSRKYIETKIKKYFKKVK